MGPGLGELGISVRGVKPLVEDTLDGPVDRVDAIADETAVYPVSANRRAEQKARAAKLGLVPGLDDLPVDSVDAGPFGAAAQRDKPTTRPRAFDASEGTAIDPLRDKTFDLNHAKTVPSTAALK